MTEAVVNSIIEVSRNAQIYLYTQGNEYKISGAFPYNTPFTNKLEIWLNDGRCFAEEDLNKVFQNGYDKDDFQEIFDKTKTLLDAFSIPHEKDKGIAHISTIFYKNNIEKLKELIEELNQIYLNFDEDLRSEQYLIKRDLMGNNRKNDFLEIPNPYSLIPDCVSLVNDFLLSIESDEISIESFEFSDKFQLISTFIEDIKSKNFNENEIKDLTKIWYTLILKGYLLFQITLVFNETEIETLQSDQQLNYFLRRYNIPNTPESIQDFLGANFLIGYFHFFYTNIGEVDISRSFE